MPSDQISIVIWRSQCSVTTSMVATPWLESPRSSRSTRSMMASASTWAAAGAADASAAVAAARKRTGRRVDNRCMSTPGSF